MTLTLTTSRGHAKIGAAIRQAVEAWKADKSDKTAAFIEALHAGGYAIEVLPAEELSGE